MKIRIALLSSVMVLFSAVSSVSAHTLVHVLSQYENDHAVVVNYNVDRFQTGLPIRFDFRLYTAASGTPIPFDRADITYSAYDSVKKSVSLPMSQDGNVIYSYVFPTVATYQLDVSFIKNEQEIAHANFPLLVTAGTKGVPFESYVGGVKGLTLSFLAGMLVLFSLQQLFKHKGLRGPLKTIKNNRIKAIISLNLLKLKI
jgi:hypothetical protein